MLPTNAITIVTGHKAIVLGNKSVEVWIRKQESWLFSHWIKVATTWNREQLARYMLDVEHIDDDVVSSINCIFGN